MPEAKVNTQQTILQIHSENTKEENSLKFTSYISEKFDLKVETLEIKSISNYLPLHHTYPFSFVKKNYLEIKEGLEKILEKSDCVMIVFAYNRKQNAQRNRISDVLMACRDLRIPYVGVPEDGNTFESLSHLAVPVGFLVEEKEKAPLSNAFCTYCGSSVELLQPKDNGTRAKKNIEFIAKVLKAHKRKFNIYEGRKSSSKIEFEALALSASRNYKILFISGSREYTLDDIFFRPKEFSVLWKSDIPVLIINPRDDIYVLCSG